MMTMEFWPELGNVEERLSADGISEENVQEELERLLQSPLFSQSDRLARFLRFAVDNALAGRTDLLKEYVIGTEVYDRRPPYHPSQDSIVRTEARRLRAKLKEYYELEGKDNPIFLYFRPGSYIPIFRQNETVAAPVQDKGPQPEGLLTRGAGAAVAVLPLADLSGSPLSASCARALTDEIIHRMTHADGVRVISRAVQSQPVDALFDITSLSQKLNIDTFVEGTVREEEGRLRITIRVLGADGYQLSSHRFETTANAASLTRINEQIATAFVHRARPSQSQIRQRRAAPGALTFAAYPLILHAESLLDEGSTSDVTAALLKFEEAIQIAPDYARSYCGKSHCMVELALRGPASSSSLVQRGKEAALGAVAVDPESVEAHSCLGSAYALEWDWEKAEKNFLHAFDLGAHVSASRRYALFLGALGRDDEALHHLETAQHMDPFSNRQKIARAKFFHITRRYADGLAAATEAALYGPYPLEAQFLMALMAAHLGDAAQAKRLIEGIRPGLSGEQSMMTGVAEVLALCGETEQAEALVRGLSLLSPRASVSRLRQALLSLALGRSEAAASLLESAWEDREAELIWIGVDPRLDPIRETEIFKDISRSVFHGAAAPKE